MGKTARFAGHLVALPFLDATEALDRTAVSARRPARGLAAYLLGLTCAWFVYVPVHELLHVAGCELTGGHVRTMTLDRVYGGKLLAAVFPFVRPGGAYAGRLTDFTTGRSDLCYLATDAAPFVLSLAGVGLLRAASRKREALLAGAATILALAPFVSLTGDYFEMASVLVTRATAPWSPPPEPYSVTGGLMALRSDDLFGLVRNVTADPGRFSGGVSGGLPAVVSVISLSAALSIALALLTYAAGDLLARGWIGPALPVRAGG